MVSPQFLVKIHRVQIRIHTMKVFIPLTDKMLDQGDLDGILVPYSPGKQLNDQKQVAVLQSRCKTSRSPEVTPNSAALPALSSNTY